MPIPSLRERPEDIPELAEQILSRLSTDYGDAVPDISADAMSALQRHSFPGNVRELENVLERAFTLCEGGRIQSEDLQLGTAAGGPAAGHTAPPSEDISRESTAADGRDPALGAAPSNGAHLPPGESLESYLEKVERKLITDALESTRWNKTAAARALGITFRALRYRLKKLELD